MWVGSGQIGRDIVLFALRTCPRRMCTTVWISMGTNAAARVAIGLADGALKTGSCPKPLRQTRRLLFGAMLNTCVCPLVASKWEACSQGLAPAQRKLAGRRKSNGPKCRCTVPRPNAASSAQTTTIQPTTTMMELMIFMGGDCRDGGEAVGQSP